MPQNDIDSEKPQNKPQQSVVDQLTTFAFGVRSFARLTYQKLSNLERANMELGIKLLKRGDYFDAYWRFKLVLFLNKNNSLAYYLLGKSLFYRGKFTEAAIALNQSLRLKPDLDEARFLLAAGGKPAEIKSLPRSFVIEKLDFVATRYEEFITGTSSHLTTAMQEELQKIIGDKMGFNVLDLGARGGDSSQILRSVANSVVGVEPSLKLSAIARTRRVNELLTFNSLVTRFPEDYLKEVKEKFAIILSTYYLDNLGALDEFFRLTANIVETGGLFVFNINRNAGAEDYKFKPSSLIFTHSTAYIEKLAAENSFSVLTKRDVKYSNDSVDVLYILEKN